MSSGGCWRIPRSRASPRTGPKTWRKLNGVMCLATQSASDVLESPISRTIIEQTPTKIFFPNADAAPEEYIGGFGLDRPRVRSGQRGARARQRAHSS